MDEIKREDFGILFNNYRETLEKIRGSSILITGGCGMIMSYFSLFILSIAEEYQITIYLQCRNKEKARKKFKIYNGKNYLHIIKFNLNDTIKLDFKPDYIIHAASPAGTNAFLETPMDVIAPNVIGTWNLLEFSKKNNIKKFLLMSSSSIYGENGVPVEQLTENDYGIVDPLNERACYIEGKRIAEQMCVAVHRQYNVHTNIIRICHTYGPVFDIENDSRIIPRVIKQILNNEKIKIYSDHDSVVQYTYIADIVSAIFCVLINGVDGEAYNAGSDNLVEVDNAIKWMVEADKSIQSELIYIPIDDNYNFSKGKGINLNKLSNSKLKKIGWKNLFNAEDGFKRTILEYINIAKCRR